jgi:hypothetical protein
VSLNKRMRKNPASGTASRAATPTHAAAGTRARPLGVDSLQVEDLTCDNDDDDDDDDDDQSEPGLSVPAISFRELKYPVRCSSNACKYNYYNKNHLPIVLLRFCTRVQSRELVIFMSV